MGENKFLVACQTGLIKAKIESGKVDPAYSKVRLILDALNRLKYEEEAKAEDIMVSKIISTRPDEKVVAVISRLHNHAISQLPVIENDKILGMVYEHNILEKSADKEFKEMRAADIMAGAPPIICTKTRVSAMVPLLKHYPSILVAEKGKPKGIISKSDVLRKMI